MCFDGMTSALGRGYHGMLSFLFRSGMFASGHDEEAVEFQQAVSRRALPSWEMLMSRLVRRGNESAT